MTPAKPPTPTNFRLTAKTAYTISVAWDPAPANSGDFNYRHRWQHIGGGHLHDISLNSSGERIRIMSAFGLSGHNSENVSVWMSEMI